MATFKLLLDSKTKLIFSKSSQTLVYVNTIKYYHKCIIYSYIYVHYKLNDLLCVVIVGIKPDDGFYDLKEISNAIEDAIGFTPGIDCNKDPEGNDQLYHIYICVDYSATRFIECPVWPGGRTCSSQIQFAKF